jgi:hypothetical protein
MKNSIFYFLYLLLFCSCGTYPQLLSTNSQKWSGGQKETGSGTRYILKMISPGDSKTFKIKEICADGYVLNHKTDKLSFIKKDTIVVYANKSSVSCESELNKGWFSYDLMGVSKKHIIKNIEEKPKLYYP